MMSQKSSMTETYVSSSSHYTNETQRVNWIVHEAVITVTDCRMDAMDQRLFSAVDRKKFIDRELIVVGTSPAANPVTPTEDR